MHPFDIHKFTEKWPELSLIHPKEMRAFLRLCRIGRGPEREAALSLLLYPEDADLPEYNFRIASFMTDSRIRVSEIPEPFLDLFCEGIAFAASVPTVLEMHDDLRPFEDFLANIPFKLLPRLFEKRFPLRPFLEHIQPDRLLPGARPNCHILKNRWRILRKNLLAQDRTRRIKPSATEKNATAWPDRATEISLGDLRFLSQARKRPGHVQKIWRMHGKAMLARIQSGPLPKPPPVEPMRRAYWQGSGTRTLAFWENLIEAQAAELTAVRNLAHDVSSRTGRVVLSWHNASLAAAGGWAFESLSTRFSIPHLYEAFARDVLEDAARIRKSFDFEAAHRLCAMRMDRLFDRKTEDGKWSGEYGEKMTDHGKPSKEDQTVWPPSSIREWTGPLSPHQQVSLEQVLAWRESAEEGWADGLILLIALASRGQEMIDSGKLSSIVLPWIDKFFISSRRKADQGYLAALFRLICLYLEKPLILFWEDTAHSQLPSLGLALKDLSQQGLPFRGIGVFDSENSLRSEALGIIGGDFPEKSLFVLRPLNDNHCPDTFRRIFRDLDFHFFRDYDSSWKDNLVFIYTGTQVMALLSIQTEMESICPWICVGKRRYPFGAWFRQILRRNVPGAKDVLCDPLFHAYSSWANLL